MRRAVVTAKSDDWPVMSWLTGICTACTSEEEKGYVSIFIITMVISVLFLLLFGLGMGNLLCVGMSGKMGKQRIYARPFFANIRFRCNCSALVYAAVSDKGGFRFFCRNV